MRGRSEAPVGGVPCSHVWGGALWLDLDIALLHQLHDTTDRAAVHFHAGQQIGVAPVIVEHGLTALLDLDPARHQGGNLILVRIAARPGADAVIDRVVEQHIPDVAVEDRHDLRVGMVGAKARDHQTHEIQAGRFIAFEGRVIEVEDHFRVFEIDRDVDLYAIRIRRAGCRRRRRSLQADRGGDQYDH